MADIASPRETTAAAAAVFTNPPRLAAAHTYLRQRGIDARQLPDDWVIGYAPPGWTRLVDTFARDFPPEALIDAGLARVSSRDTLIDTFRDRVMFGIRDADGSIAGFIGRDLSGHPGAPKYLNTPQHELFDKSGLLYGLHEGNRDRCARQPVLVEGPLDVLAIATRRHGEHDRELLPIAACGTALSERQAHLIANLARCHESPAVIAMDGDAAGRAAALTAGERLRNAGLDVRVAMLPPGTDPAEHLARPDSTLDVFHADHALPLINLYVKNAIAQQGDRMQWVEGRLAALRSLAPYLATYPPDYIARQVGWLADALGIDSSTVTLDLAAACNRQIRFQSPRAIVDRGTAIVG